MTGEELKAKVLIWVKATIAALAVAACGLWLNHRYGAVREVADFELALLAIGFAMYQFTDSAELKRASSEIKRTVNTVAEASNQLRAMISTRYIAPFPSNMGEIKKLVVNSHCKLKIMTDIVGYASYSRVHEFLEYLVHLEELRQLRQPRVEVLLLVYDRPSRDRALSDQFPPDNWPAIKSSAEFDTFFRIHEHRFDRPERYEDFIRILGENNDYYEQRLFDAGVKIRHRGAPLPFFAWLCDSHEAVFTFLTRRPLSVGAKVREITFATREGQMIETFDAIFDSLWESAAEETPRTGGTSPSLV